MRIYLLLFGVLAAQFGAATLSTPAAAKMPSTSAVVAACKNTPSCHYRSCGKGCAKGCSDYACFDCAKGKCVGTVFRTGGSTPIRSGNLIHVLNAGIKTTGRATTPKHGARPVKVGGIKERRHGRVVKTSGLKKKAIYRSHPTDSGGKGLTGYRSTGPTFPNTTEHHSGGHR